MKIYNQLVLENNVANLDGQRLEAVIGKHCVWLPAIETKFILSFGGEIESSGWMRGSNKEKINDFTIGCDAPGFTKESFNSIVDEIKILSLLAEYKMSPPIIMPVYVKNFTSKMFTTGYHNDNIGLYGYNIRNANKLEKGQYSFSKFKSLFLDTNIITANPGALGDLEKKEGNLVNGYLVDVRRSRAHMMAINTSECSILSEYKENKDALQKKILELSQFPHKERSQNYQSYFIDGEYVKGTRDTLYRFDRMKISLDLTKKSVLDLGCQLGTIATECYKRGARKVTGLEYEADYVNCARDLARYNGFHINFMQKNILQTADMISYINEYYPEPIDIVFLLSLYKHTKGAEFQILENIKWKTCYVESHNTGTLGIETGHVKEMIKYMDRINCKKEFLGFTEDRSPRAIWRLNR